jgi:mRNA interferase RelE/StbE
VSYEVITTRKANKALAKLPDTVYGRMKDKIDALANDPRPHDCEPLTGRLSGYRIRAGDYRALYEVDDDLRIVRVYRIKHRGAAYRR